MAASKNTPAAVPKKALPDEKDRHQAKTERRRNVIVNAGAGTGKTSILVSRFVEMVAPESSAIPAIPISRVAAITFTRKAAGELRLRIRERLLANLATVTAGSARETRLRDALAGLDTAYVGTIHSFADRLLRLRPVEASLSPSYEIAESDEELVRETFQILVEAGESRTLAAELAGHSSASRAEEVSRIVLDAQDAGLRTETYDTDWKAFYGLEALVAGFVRQRDIPPEDAPPAKLDFNAFRLIADEFVRESANVQRGSVGANWIVATAAALADLRNEDDPVVLYREVNQQLRRVPKDVSKGVGFGNDKEAWRVWKLYFEGGKTRPVPLRKDLRAPLERWMASRLVRLFPVVVALYEKVKARHRQLDQLDLLFKLRQLLTDYREVRADFQKMFDHIFVDEFQDTDPLQAEIVLFLCEREPLADRWEDVVLADGKLTVVGDAKQSIYRFRRADVAMYDRVLSVIKKGDPLEVRLSTNFRSVPPLIEWFNDRFERILKPSPDGRPFDPKSGRVFHQPLDAGRDTSSPPPVHVLALELGDEPDRKEFYRALEGQALARYLRRLTESDDVQISDPLAGGRRRIRYGDIAILATSTWNLEFLFEPLDAEGVPYASRGGVLFLADPLHRLFLLGMRGVADKDDGIAMAALLRPPFFAVDPADLLRERVAWKAGIAPTDESPRRAREAREFVLDLRRRRFERPPGATARDLLERTGFGRSVASGPNGTQRLARLRELCLLLEQRAADEGLDYDAATSRLREWVDAPIQLDPPHPVGTEAVQIMTVHQAKGLEFPVVVLWDGKGEWTPRVDNAPWRMERDGRGWMIELDGLIWEEPADLGIRDTEKAYQEAERERVAYVATTRARDLLIIPKAGNLSKPGKIVCSHLLLEAPPHLLHELEPYISGKKPAWAKEKRAQAQTKPADGAKVEGMVRDWWKQASADAARPRFQPASVSGQAHTAPRDETEEALELGPRKPHPGRFGNVFGTTVHKAIGLVLRDPALSPSQAVARAVLGTGLTEHIEEAAADVTRALQALRAEGLLRPLGTSLQIEYPVAGGADGGLILGGYIDLLSATDARLDLIDFKTDQPPNGPVEVTHSAYVAQVQAYGRLLGTAELLGHRRLRCGLLFTADGTMRWDPPLSPPKK